LDAIPEYWPPTPPRVVPLFPLPGVFLFPRLPLPLQVFEPRYLQMVEDLLDSPGRLVVGTIQEQELEDAMGSPAVLPVAGFGEIVRHEKLVDGRYLLWVIGLARVRIHEVPSDRLYRQVEFEVLEDKPANPRKAEELVSSLSEAILARSPQLLNLPDDAPVDMLADLLLQTMVLPQSVMETIFSEQDSAQRAAMALSAHARFPTSE